MKKWIYYAGNKLASAHNVYMKSFHNYQDYFNPGEKAQTVDAAYESYRKTGKWEHAGKFDFSQKKRNQMARGGPANNTRSRRPFKRGRSTSMSVSSGSMRTPSRGRTRSVSMAPRRALSAPPTPFGTGVRTIGARRRRSQRIRQSTGQYVGKFTRPTRSTSGGVYTQAFKSGHIETLEIGKIQEGFNTVWVVHSTFAAKKILLSAVKSLLHKGWNHSGNYFTSWTAGTPFADEYSISVEYKISPNGSLIQEDYFPAVGITYDAVALGTYNMLLNTLADPTKITYEPVMFYMRRRTASSLDPYFNIYKVPMDCVKVHWTGSSSLKVQNRSITVTGDDNEDQADDVDNVPLQGTILHGNGTGFKLKQDYSGNGFYVNSSFGVFSGSSGDIAVAAGSEPFTAKQLQGVSAQGRILLNPGKIKDSYLFSKGTMYFNTLWKSLRPIELVASDYIKLPYGKANMIMLEKQIHVSSDNIRVAYEHNHKTSTYISIATRVTQPQFAQAVI